MSESNPIEQAAVAIHAADRVVVLTGAGVSADSGIPTFREAQTGLWARYAPQDLATPDAFAADPERVWAWYRWRRDLIARGGVNAGHAAVAALERYLRVVVATQNVDGLHAMAGSTDICELHGNIWRERCADCHRERLTPMAQSHDNAPLPRCEHCGAMTRPGVVWFGEMLPADALERAHDAIARCACVLVAGTSNTVYPAAALVDAAVAGPATVIEINPQPTPASHRVDIRIADAASHALPAIVCALDALHAAG